MRSLGRDYEGSKGEGEVKESDYKVVYYWRWGMALYWEAFGGAHNTNSCIM